MNFDRLEEFRASPKRQYIDLHFTQSALDDLSDVLATATLPDPMLGYVIGDSGVGKTSLITLFAKEANAHFNNRHAVALVKCGSVLGDKTLHSTALEALGDLSPTSGTLVQMDYRLRVRIRELGVQMVIFDDYHHVIEQTGPKVARRMTDSIKALCNKTNICVVFAGTSEIDQVRDINEQIDTRMPVLIEIPKLGIVTEKGRDEFRAFITRFCEIRELNIAFNVSSDESVFNFYCATNGNLRLLQNLLKKSELIAAREKRDTVTQLDIADAVASMKPRHLQSISRSLTEKAKVARFHSKKGLKISGKQLKVYPFSSPISSIKQYLGVKK